MQRSLEAGAARGYLLKNMPPSELAHVWRIEQLVSCCSCPVTPNGLVSLSAKTSITGAICANVYAFTGFTSSFNFPTTSGAFQTAYSGVTDAFVTKFDDFPLLSKFFNPASIPLGATTTLTFTINNKSLIAATGAAFTDLLPCGLLVSTPNRLTGSCGGSVITAVAGTNTVRLSSGSIPATASCTFSVGVLSVLAGVCLNTTSALVTTEFGTGLPAIATLAVNLPPVITKTFNPTKVSPGGITTLSLSIANPNPASALTGVAFTDNLPAGTVVSTPNGLQSDCGGTATAVSGTVTPFPAARSRAAARAPSL